MAIFKENAEFHAAKERQRFVDARLSQLKQRLGGVFTRRCHQDSS